jgi:hypothetical protein
MRDPRDNLERAARLYHMAGPASAAAEAAQLLRAAAACVELAEAGSPEAPLKAETAAMRRQITAQQHCKPRPAPPAANTRT